MVRVSSFLKQNKELQQRHTAYPYCNESKYYVNNIYYYAVSSAYCVVGKHKRNYNSIQVRYYVYNLNR